MKRLLEIGCAVVLLHGCVGVAYRPDAFGPGKRMAVVGLCAGPKIQFASEGRTLSGLIKSAGTASYDGDAAPALSASKAAVFKALAATGKFALVPEKKVVSSAAYREFPEEADGLRSGSCVPAKGYKIPFEEAAIGELAHGLNVDGALVVGVNYFYKFHGASVLGLISAGSVVATARVTVQAVDPAGQVIWRDAVMVNSDDSIPSVGESVDMEKLRPLLVNATQRAMDQLLQRFADHV